MDTKIIDTCKQLAEAGQWDELKRELEKHFASLPTVKQASADAIIDTMVAQMQLDNAIFVPALNRVEALYDQLAELDKADAAIDEAVAKHDLRQKLKES